MFGWFRNRRRKRLLQSPWPKEWDSILRRNVGHYKTLSDSEQLRLKQLTKVFVAEKNWEAHDELEMTDEIKVTIAGSACLLLLGVDGFYFDNVKTIIVFPQPVRRQTRDGLIVNRESHHSGEAWQGGPVVLSWQDVVHDSRHPTSGRNLVIHEFAHCLDGLDGEMGGSLDFGDRELAERWQQVCTHEFEELTHAARYGEPALLDYYGATNLAEFFAVASETFFERPKALERHHPELFELLGKYYRVSPKDWV